MTRPETSSTNLASSAHSASSARSAGGTRARVLLAVGVLAAASAAAAYEWSEPASKPAPGQAATKASVEAQLARCAPLIGYWRGQLGGTPIEEAWLPEAGGNITGVLRWYDDAGAVRMHELISIDATEQDLRYTLRHFSPGLAPWESELEAGPMVFILDEQPDPDGRLIWNTNEPERGVARIVYAFPDEDQMLASVEFPEGSGQPPVVIPFERVEAGL
ncbi:MAG: DUF6265 family protein [Planctomycetota bacterium]